MGLFFNGDVKKLYVGSTEVKEVYIGGQKVWPVGLPVGTTFDFDYTGAVQSVELPIGKYKLQCWGAQGGTSYGSSSGVGSKGGYSEGVLTLTEKTTLYVFVGGKGSRGSSSSLINGGWNGGGASVGYTSYSSSGTNGYSYPACGGGATDISTVTSSMSYSGGRTNRSAASLLARCIVAGGGAGGSYRYTSVTTETTTWQTIATNQYADYATAVGDGFYYWASFIPVSVGYKYVVTSYSGSNGYFEVYNNGSFVKTTSSFEVTSSTYTLKVLGWSNTYGIDTNVKVATQERKTDTSTSTSSGYSNKSQQGGGTSGKGQYPGTQSSAGSNGGFGYGANQQVSNYRYAGGGGGGGWYGGGTSYSDSSTSYVNYSGGGSGFVNTAANASYRPTNYTGLQLDSGTTTAGNSSHPSTSGGTETGHSGNGYARITVIE